MRPIKFRGRVPEGYHHYGGQVVYGSLVIYPENAPWIQGYPNWIVPIDDRRSYPVDADSIAQFVGLDSAGNEVYEGDILVDELEQEYTAEIYDRPEKIHALKLKEAQP